MEREIMISSAHKLHKLLDLIEKQDNDLYLLPAHKALVIELLGTKHTDQAELQHKKTLTDVRAALSSPAAAFGIYAKKIQDHVENWGGWAFITLTTHNTGLYLPANVNTKGRARRFKKKEGDSSATTKARHAQLCVRSFHERLSKSLGYKTKRSLGICSELGIGENQNYHAHLFIEVPDWLSLGEFKQIAEAIWCEMGNTQKHSIRIENRDGNAEAIAMYLAKTQLETQYLGEFSYRR
jgi:hypothetical protein